MYSTVYQPTPSLLQTCSVLTSVPPNMKITSPTVVQKIFMKWLRKAGGCVTVAFSKHFLLNACLPSFLEHHRQKMEAYF